MHACELSSAFREGKSVCLAVLVRNLFAGFVCGVPALVNLQVSRV